MAEDFLREFLIKHKQQLKLHDNTKLNSWCDALSQQSIDYEELLGFSEEDLRGALTNDCGFNSIDTGRIIKVLRTIPESLIFQQNNGEDTGLFTQKNLPLQLAAAAGVLFSGYYIWKRRRMILLGVGVIGGCFLIYQYKKSEIKNNSDNNIVSNSMMHQVSNTVTSLFSQANTIKNTIDSVQKQEIDAILHIANKKTITKEDLNTLMPIINNNPELRQMRDKLLSNLPRNLRDVALESIGTSSAIPNEAESSLFLDGLVIEMGKQNIVSEQTGKLISFINHEEYDTDSLMNDSLVCVEGKTDMNNNDATNICYNQSNIKHEIEQKTFDVFINYIDSEKLKQLQDGRFDELMKELCTIGWRDYQIRMITNWFYDNRNRYEYDDLNEKIFQELCAEPHMNQLLPRKAARNLYLAYENVNNCNNIDRFANESNCAIDSCSSLKKIIDKLYKYEQNDIKTDDVMEAHENMLNQFHHMLFAHLNNSKEKEAGDFSFIHDECSRLIECDAKECKKLKRNYRNRQQSDEQKDMNKEDEHVQIYRDLLDTIHCYFIHSVDMGYRKYSNTDDDYKESDDEIEDVKWLKTDSKTTKLVEEIVIGQNKYQKQKYCSIIPDVNYKEEETKTTENRPKNFSFGHTHYYWDEYKYNDDPEPYCSANYGYKVRDWYIDKKYESIKQEILNNKFCTLTTVQYNYAISKTKSHLKSNRCKQIVCHNRIYGIPIGSELKMEHVLVVVLYTDYTDLSYYFSKTFRKQSSTETNEDMKSRNSEFFNWSKTLRETVECYGISFRDKSASEKIFYHGINNTNLTFPSFIAYFAGPTSTSGQSHVAVRFASDNGMVLYLEKNIEYGWDLNFFDCSFISCHSSEDERLFFGGLAPLSFYSIFKVAGTKSYRHFIVALKVLTSVLKGQKMDKQIIKKRTYIIIKKLMGVTNKYDVFVNKLFSSFSFYTKEIRIDLRFVVSCYPKIAEILFSKSNKNLPLLVDLCNVFKNNESIKIYEVGKINKLFIDELIVMIKQIKQRNDCKLKDILLYGVQYNKKYFPNPFVSKVKEVFNENCVKMELLSISSNRCDVMISTDDFKIPNQIAQSSKTFAMDDSDIKEEEHEELEIFEHGIAFSYWKECSLYPLCKPKYETLKEEAIENEIKLELQEFNQAMTIAQNIGKNQWISKKNLKWNWYTQINPGQQISNEHILAIILFTNYSRLCTEMRRVCRKLFKEEHIEEVTKRHSKYVNWLKLLCECVMIYGETATWKQQFYHGLTEKLFFLKLQNIEFHQPTSMTTRKSGTYKYIGGNKGLILQYKCLHNNCRFFNTKNISSSPYENEVLFFHCSMKLLQIYDVNKNNYINTKPLILIDKIVNGKFIENKNMTQKQTETDLSETLNGNNNEDFTQQLVKHSFKECDEIVINPKEISKKIETKALKQIFIEENENGIKPKIEEIKKLTNKKHIKIDDKELTENDGENGDLWSGLRDFAIHKVKKTLADDFKFDKNDLDQGEEIIHDIIAKEITQIPYGDIWNSIKK